MREPHRDAGEARDRTQQRAQPTRIKICGLSDTDAIADAVDAGADAVGFVFVESSRRFIAPEAAYELMASLSPFVTAVGVVQDLSVNAFLEVEQACPCHLMQLHGNESPQVVRQCGPGVMKAVRFPGADEATGTRSAADALHERLAQWDAIAEVDAILVDGPRPGSGETLDWQAVAQAVGPPGRRRINKPLVLAGGLTPDNVGHAVAAVRPYGVDVSSGVEGSDGRKDAKRMIDFCAAVREADAAA